MGVTGADRYAGKPMLRLLDSYVLDAIGALDETTAAELAGNVPRLAQALRVPATTWQQVVEGAMGMPKGADDGVRGLWAEYVEAALADGGTPDPISFAHRVNDTRFRDAG